MFNLFKNFLANKIRLLIRDEIKKHIKIQSAISATNDVLKDSVVSTLSRVSSPYKIVNSTVGDYTYISERCILHNVTILKFCSVGPNLIAGYGLHPIDGISTSPMFYSTLAQNGVALGTENKFQEYKPISIGNDVFIGANVTILDGVSIGNGAVIGAGAVVSKDIPPYAVAVGVPIRIIKFRFDDITIAKLEKIRWWDWEDEKLREVERNFYKVKDFSDKYTNE